MRGFLIGGNSAVLADGVVAAESEGVGYVGDLGTGELSLSVAGGCFSAEVMTIGRAVIERLAVCPVIAGATLSLIDFTVGSETTVEVCLGRVKP